MGLRQIFAIFDDFSNYAWHSIGTKELLDKYVIKLRPFSRSAEQSEVCVSKECNFIAPQALIRQLYYILVALYFIALELKL